VVHQGGSQRAAFHMTERFGLLDIRNETGRRRRPAAQFPSERIKKRSRLRSIRIIEALPIEVLWKSRIAYVFRSQVSAMLLWSIGCADSFHFPSPRTTRHEECSNNNMANFNQGAQVEHQKFGLGTVLSSSDERIVIKFDDHGEKKFVTTMVVTSLKKSDRQPPAEKRASRARKPKAAVAVPAQA
jgi:hypothetical protein